MDKNKTIAVFDFDGTITTKDTFLEFLKFCKGNTMFYICLFINFHFIILYYFKIYPNYKLKERFFSFYFKGKNETDVKKNGEAFSINIIPKLCFKNALKLIRWHQNHKHDIYVISASSAIWIGAWCANNNIKLFSTDFEVVNGFYTGKINGINLYGKEKAKVLNEILNINNYKLSYGYGNSTSDKYFLELTDIPFNKSLKNFKY